MMIVLDFVGMVRRMWGLMLITQFPRVFSCYFLGGGGSVIWNESTTVEEEDTLLIRKHFLHVTNMSNIHLLIPKNLMHVSLTCPLTCWAQQLGNDTHVRAMKRL